jgi:flagellar protein FliO/FliZ
MKRIAAVILPSTLVAESALAAPTVAMADLTGIVVSLALVVGFILAAAWVVRRMPLGGLGRGNGPLKILAALPLGPRERLVLVEARGEELLIAVSPAGVFNVGAAEVKSHARSRAAEPTFVLPDPT